MGFWLEHLKYRKRPRYGIAWALSVLRSLQVYSGAMCYLTLERDIQYFEFHDASRRGDFSDVTDGFAQ